MSMEDAIAAIESAVEAEGGDDTQSLFAASAQQVRDQAPAPSAPQGDVEPSAAAPPVAQPSTPVAPAEGVGAPAQEDSLFEGKINPDQLPPELQALAKQFEGAYTRKTQALAEQRKQLEAQFGDVNVATEAVQLYQQLQDPRNWPRFAEEINQLMQQNGIQPGPAPVATPTAPAVTAGPATELSAQLSQLAEQFPELAPLKGVAGVVSDLQSQLAQTQAAMEMQRNQLAVEMRQQAQAGEFARQEGILRSEGLNDNAMNRVYTISQAPVFGGNLLNANAFLQDLKTEILAEYLSSKEQIANTPIAPITGAGAVSHEPPARPKTLEDATKIAMETLKAAGLDTLDW